ncbi:MAG TPA: hypothetical protein VGE84_05870 [Allosphingosinicella sp.]
MPKIQQGSRLPLGRISRDTRGPPGAHMEVSGLWDKPGLSG